MKMSNNGNAFIVRDPGACPCCGQPVDTSRLYVDLNTNLAAIDRRLIRLAGQEAIVLRKLVDAWPSSVPYSQIVAEVWTRPDQQPEAPKSALSNVIWRLRRRVRRYGVEIIAVNSGWHEKDGGYRVEVKR